MKTRLKAGVGLAAVSLLCTAAQAAESPPRAERAPQAQRVVTLAPHLAELVCAAAGCEVLVAVGAYSNYPPAVLKLPVMGDVAQLNVEALLALRPTQVIAWGGGTPVAQIEKLRSLQLPLTVLRIERLDEVASALRSLGRVLGTSARAEAAASAYTARLAALRQQHVGVRPLRVLYQLETAPVYSINAASPISEAITLCGGRNVFAGLSTLSAPVSDEAVLAARPEVVVHGPGDREAVTRYWSRFAKAARQAPVLVAIDPDLLARAGPRLVDGVGALCSALDAVRGRQSRVTAGQPMQR